MVTCGQGLAETLADTPPAWAAQGPSGADRRPPAGPKGPPDPRLKPAVAQATQLMTSQRGRGSWCRASDPRPPGPPGARLAKRKFLRPPFPAPQGGLGWGRPLPSRAPSPALDTSKPARSPRTSSCVASWGGGGKGGPATCPDLGSAGAGNPFGWGVRVLGRERERAGPSCPPPKGEAAHRAGS